jgi:hypothetical protein
MTLFRTQMRPLPCRKPMQGREYCVVDDALPNAHEVRARCPARTDWELDYPDTGEAWPGNVRHARLLDDELAAREDAVCQLNGAKKVWVEQAGADARLNHNRAPVVASVEAAVNPHADSSNLCRDAAVLYLNPAVPESCGTSSCRQRMPGRQLGGNIVLPLHRNLVEALGNRFVQPNAFVEDVRVAHRHNRLLVYKASLIHSASAYWGLKTAAGKRTTALFFRMA